MAESDDHPSTYKGQVFTGMDAETFRSSRSFANPLYQGTDLKALERVQVSLEEL